MKILRISLASFMVCIHCFTAQSQITAGDIQQFISGNNQLNKTGLYDLYSRLNYQTVWIQKASTRNRDILLQTLKQAARLALREKDYQYDFIESFKSKYFKLGNKMDTLRAEILLSDAALHFYHDIAFGNSRPPFRYDGLKYTPACENIPALLAQYISTNSLQTLRTRLTVNLPEVTIIENKLNWYNTIMANIDFKELRVISNKLDITNKALIKKLYHLGILYTIPVDLTDSILKKKVIEAQIQFNIQADGKIGSNTLRELNMPLSARKEMLNISINYYRWLNCLSKVQAVITVNIPAAYMKVYSNSKVILEMRMIVGKRTTPTPMLTSTINEVILYPYWHVPVSIATKELLPAIKRNPGFINAGNYQVLNKSGKIMNPYSINWNALSRTNFPYIIRQSTGCDNALGLLKLNFYNPYNVYLHDTNSRTLFKNSRRYYSHGCLRMEKPMELGHLVLQHNQVAIDTLEQKGCLRNQSPISVPADVKMPVIVWYNPAGINMAGRLIFFEDIYRKLNLQ